MSRMFGMLDIGPEFVAIGYDNGLPEPPLVKTMALIDALEAHEIRVWRKTLREGK